MTAFATIISKQAVVVCPFFENIRNMCALLDWHFADKAVCFCVQKREVMGYLTVEAYSVRCSPTQERMAEALFAVWEIRQNFLQGINLW